MSKRAKDHEWMRRYEARLETVDLQVAAQLLRRFEGTEAIARFLLRCWLAPSDSELRGIGQRLQALYSIAPQPGVHVLLCIALVRLLISVTEESHSAELDDHDESLLEAALVGLYAWAREWWRISCPTVYASNKQVGSLALSDLSNAQLEALVPPWRAFLLHIDDSCLSVSGRPINRVLVSFIEGHWYMSVMTDHVPMALMGSAQSVFRRLSPADSSNASEEQARVMELVGRAVLNLCYAVTHPASRQSLLRPKVKQRGRKGRKARNQPSNTHIFGMPVKLDMTKHIRDYLSGKSSRTCKVRWVVRGHWRNQACGKGRQERRPTWIEPYWKGPEGAPTILREAVVT